MNVIKVNQIGIIIQARTGSTRLPNKVLLPFFNGQSVLEILINRITNACSIPLVVATSSLSSDDGINSLCEKLNVPCFRGDETNVLKRFIDCAHHFQLDTVIRVCADNPFLEPQFINELIELFNIKKCDYMSYKTSDGIPAMKSHIGVFSEIMKVKTLMATQKLTSDKLFTEHVTNFIYGNPQMFDVAWINMPIYLTQEKIRLTLDDADDFETLKQLYHEVISKYKTVHIETVVSVLLKDQSKLTNMVQQINKYSK
jgi:spore coat polysaccharide biosynthesis protein SpsF